MKKIISIIMAVAMTMAIVTGCGSSSKGGGGTLDDGVLTVGTNAEFPPFEYVGDDGEPDGFDIALIKAIGEKIGVDVEIQNMEFDSLVSSIGSKTDVAIAGMTVTEERKQSVDFSDPYFEAIQHVLVPTGSDIEDYDDLSGKVIGVQLGATADLILEEIEGVDVQRYNKHVDAVNDLINDRLDAVVVDKNPAEVFAEKYAGQIEDLDGEQFGFEKEEYAIAMPKGDEVLAAAINEALAELKNDGTYDKLVEQYIQ